MDWDKASAELRKKLDQAHVKPATKYGPKGDYLEAWHVQAEANRIFGFGGWTQEIVNCAVVMERERGIGKEQKPGWGVTYTATVRVRVGDVVREDAGAGHGYDVDLGLAHESAIKEAVSDAMKRAFKSFGNPLGLALYDKSRENVGVEVAEIDIKNAVAAIQASDTLHALGAYWKALYTQNRDVADHPDVVKAKDAAKARFEQEKAA